MTPIIAYLIKISGHFFLWIVSYSILITFSFYVICWFVYINKIYIFFYKLKEFCAAIFKMPLAFLLLLIPCFNFWSAEKKMKPRKVENMKILLITLQNCGNIIKENIKCWRPAQMAVGLVVLIWGYNVCVCNALLPSFSQVWAVSISITLFLHLCLHLSDHVLHSPQLRNTQTVSHTDIHTQTFVLVAFSLCVV